MQPLNDVTMKSSFIGWKYLRLEEMNLIKGSTVNTFFGIKIFRFKFMFGWA